MRLALIVHLRSGEDGLLPLACSAAQELASRQVEPAPPVMRGASDAG